MSKRIYVDMDDTIADFHKATKCPITQAILQARMFDPKFFYKLDPIPGAKSALFLLDRMGYDIHILTQPFIPVPESYTDKVKWIQMHFPQLVNKITMTQDKGLLLGDYLVDDNLKWASPFAKNGGNFIHFNYGGYNLDNNPGDPQELWAKIITFFEKEADKC